MMDAPQVASRGDTDGSEHPVTVQENNPIILPTALPQPSVPGRTEQDMEPKFSSGEIDPARLEELTVKLELEELLEQRRTLLTEEEKEKAWADAADMVKTYSDEMVDRWNKVIDTYLVFAGLFSAILTAFNVQSYPLLQPPTADPVAVLQQISLQLHSFSINPPFVNSTVSPAVSLPSNAAAAVPQSMIWLNILWFSGLITSLTSALLGILVKQWLNEYVSLGLSGNSREAARRRQYRLNNLVKWRVGDIVIVIPVLLLVSLGLFLAGLLVLLWTLHPTVAVVASVLVGVVGVFTIGVTFLPLFNHGCAYLTPQTFAFYSLWRRVLYPVVSTIGYYIVTKSANQLCEMIPNRFLPYIIEDILLDATYLFPRTTPQTSPWYIHERRTVNGLSDTLDLDILNEAYDTTLDVKAVSAAAVCLLDQPPIHILDYFLRLQKTAKKRFFRGPYTNRCPKDELLLHQVLLCTLRLSTMEPFAKDCSQIWQHSYAFLPMAGGHTRGGNARLSSEQAVWLHTVASWLERRVLNPDTSKVRPPIGWIEIDPLRQYCLILSGEGQITTRRSGTSFFSDIASIPSRRAYNPLHREVVRCFELADTFSPLRLRNYKKPGRRTRPPQVQTQLSCLRSAREFLTYAAHILSSSDPAAPRDHHVVRDHMHAVLFDVHSFLFCDFGFEGRKTLRHLSHEHLDLASDLVNGLALAQLCLLPLVVELGLVQPERLRKLYSRLESMQRKQYFSGSQESVIQSLENFKLAIDAYERQYMSLELRPGRSDDAKLFNSTTNAEQLQPQPIPASPVAREPTPSS